MTDDEPHRSRTAWPGPMSVAGVEPGHEHELPTPLLQRVRLQGRAIVIFGVCLLGIGTLLVLIILGRGAERDREQDELKREIRDSWCTALDTLPEGGVLDLLRDKYDCGPGKPIADLPQDVQRELAGRARPSVSTPAPAGPAPPVGSPREFGDGASGNAPPPMPAAPPPARGEPAPEPPPPGPVVDLEPITERVCDLAGVCA